MRMSTRIVLVRHGQTSANSARLLCGSTDVPLDAVGERQAELVAQRIATELDVEALITSPLLRARATATRIHELTNCAMEEMADLREVNFGDLEGSTIEHVRSDHPQIVDLMLDPHNTSLRWPNGDHMHEFYTRTQRALAEIARAHVSRTVVVVAHGAVIGGYLRFVSGSPINAWRTHGVRNCSISLVNVVDGQPSVDFANDCSHLDDVLELAQEA